MIVQGCYRPSHPLMTEDDIVICVCNICAAICLEDPKVHVKSLWEALQDGRESPFPDLRHKAMTLQDYWRYYDRRTERDVVHRILYRTNVSVVELKEDYERTRFCRTSLHQPLIRVNVNFAPRCLVKEAQGMFIPKAEEEQKALMWEHCSNMHTDKVVCYCVPCTKGVRAGGEQEIHPLDLSFESV